MFRHSQLLPPLFGALVLVSGCEQATDTVTSTGGDVEILSGHRVVEGLRRLAKVQREPPASGSPWQESHCMGRKTRLAEDG